MAEAVLTKRFAEPTKSFSPCALLVFGDGRWTQHVQNLTSTLLCTDVVQGPQENTRKKWLRCLNKMFC